MWLLISLIIWHMDFGHKYSSPSFHRQAGGENLSIVAPRSVRAYLLFI